MSDTARLAESQKSHLPHYRGYGLKGSLEAAIAKRGPSGAARALRAWLAWASCSQRSPIVRMAKTIRSRSDEVLGDVQHRVTTGVVEGIKNRLLMIARRSCDSSAPAR